MGRKVENNFERIVHSTIKLCGLLADKSIDYHLTEDEALVFQQGNNMLRQYYKFQSLILEKAALDCEKELIRDKIRYEQWLKEFEHDNGATEAPDLST